MIDRLVVRHATYYDSVTLMLASRDAQSVEGVSFVAAVAATPVNLDLLLGQGFEPPTDLKPNDLIVAIRAADDPAADAAAAAVEGRLAARLSVPPEGGPGPPLSIAAAARRNPAVNVAFVSVPGRFAAYETADAIEAGLHVFCFSDGMSISDEAELKRRARDKGLLFMGADCGTAIIDGVAFGFVNAVERGPVGIVGASGTGIQQVTCLLDAAGIGVSHAIGVGGRDLSAGVGGTTTIQALDLLAADDGTEVIGVISKPPDPQVAERVIAAAEEVGKPVVFGLLGLGDELGDAGRAEVTTSLEEVAMRLAERAGRTVVTRDADPPGEVTTGAIRGLFCGGSLCFEASSVVAAAGAASEFVDFGDDEYTQGRVHPMIDPIVRNQAFARTSSDESVGAVVLDVVLGYGAHADPAAELAPIIEESMRSRSAAWTVVVSVCGTDGDPQDVGLQMERLSEAGAVVTRNAAHAARLALAATGNEG